MSNDNEVKSRKVLVEFRDEQVEWLDEYKSREFIQRDAPAVRKLALERLEQLKQESLQREQDRQAVA